MSDTNKKKLKGICSLFLSLILALNYGVSRIAKAENHLITVIFYKESAPLPAQQEDINNRIIIYSHQDTDQANGWDRIFVYPTLVLGAQASIITAISTYIGDSQYALLIDVAGAENIAYNPSCLIDKNTSAPVDFSAAGRNPIDDETLKDLADDLCKLAAQTFNTAHQVKIPPYPDDDDPYLDGVDLYDVAADNLVSAELGNGYWIIPKFPIEFGEIDPSKDNYLIEDESGGSPHIVDCRHLASKNFSVQIISENADGNLTPRMKSADGGYVEYSIKETPFDTGGSDLFKSDDNIITYSNLGAHPNPGDTYNQITSACATNPTTYAGYNDIVALYFCVTGKQAAKVSHTSGHVFDKLEFKLTINDGPKDPKLYAPPGPSAP